MSDHEEKKTFPVSDDDSDTEVYDYRMCARYPVSDPDVNEDTRSPVSRLCDHAALDANEAPRSKTVYDKTPTEKMASIPAPTARLSWEQRIPSGLLVADLADLDIAPHDPHQNPKLKRTASKNSVIKALPADILKTIHTARGLGPWEYLGDLGGKTGHETDLGLYKEIYKDASPDVVELVAHLESSYPPVYASIALLHVFALWGGAVVAIASVTPVGTLNTTLQLCSLRKSQVHDRTRSGWQLRPSPTTSTVSFIYYHSDGRKIPVRVQNNTATPTRGSIGCVDLSTLPEVAVCVESDARGQEKDDDEKGLPVDDDYDDDLVLHATACAAACGSAEEKKTPVEGESDDGGVVRVHVLPVVHRGAGDEKASKHPVPQHFAELLELGALCYDFRLGADAVKYVLFIGTKIDIRQEVSAAEAREATLAAREVMFEDISNAVKSGVKTPCRVGGRAGAWVDPGFFPVIEGSNFFISRSRFNGDLVADAVSVIVDKLIRGWKAEVDESRRYGNGRFANCARHIMGDLCVTFVVTSAPFVPV